MSAPQSICVLIDSNGNVVVEYCYDAWGTHTVSGSNLTLANLNPFRYRGYYYDTETGLYYLQTRYYDPEVGRFLNRDAVTYADPNTIGGVNLYSYCLNNPVIYSDPTGHFAITLTAIGLIAGAIVGATAGGVVAYSIAKNNGVVGWELFGWTMLGVFGGGLLGAAIGAGIGALVTKATGIVGLSITKYSIIPIKNVTVLGNMPGYISAATSSGSGYYLISDKLWNSMSEAERWANNMQYLIDANKLHSQFALVPDKVVKAGSTFWKEIQFLITNGIPWTLF